MMENQVEKNMEHEMQIWFVRGMIGIIAGPLTPCRVME